MWPKIQSFIERMLKVQIDGSKGFLDYNLELPQFIFLIRLFKTQKLIQSLLNRKNKIGLVFGIKCLRISITFPNIICYSIRDCSHTKHSQSMYSPKHNHHSPYRY